MKKKANEVSIINNISGIVILVRIILSIVFAAHAIKISEICVESWVRIFLFLAGSVIFLLGRRTDVNTFIKKVLDTTERRMGTS